MTWIEVRATAGSREALVRCALDLLRAHGVELLRASPIEAVASASAGEADAVRCVAEVRAADVDRALTEVTDALEKRVAFSPAAARADAVDPAAALVGFRTESIDHTADEAFAVEGRDRADLLAAAAEALGGLIVHAGRVLPMDAIAVEVHAPEPRWADDDRLFAWLAEVLFTLDKGRLALRRAVVLEDGERGVSGILFGEPIDEDRHEVRGGIKAVTYHGLTIEKVGGGMRAEVVIDV